MLIAWIAAAVITPVGLAEPDRLTAGPANQYLGAAAPAEGAPAREIYFTSDEESTTQIYVQELASGVPRLAFDELADVTWPRPSPDGRWLLYLSYREDAAGDLCLREIRGAVGARTFGPRRCLTGPDTAELQAVWFPDSRHIAVVTRPGLHGDFELRRLSIDGGGEGGDRGGGKGGPGAKLFSGSASSPALSPDGQWLVTAPVERGEREIGPSFLGRSTGALELARLGGGSDAGRGGGGRGPEPLRFDLPGASAMPAFSRDGRWLYFTQFLNDTNFDGSIDGNDHGVLFRASFAGGVLGAPEQLSSARWSCQYPSPAADRLLATCLEDGSLDVFSLPLGGAIPEAWRAQPALLAERIDDELTSSRDRWERLLLLAHRGATPAVMREMIRLHLESGEYQSALFYAARIEGSEPAVAAALRELAEERRAERALERGALSAPFVREARARLLRLAANKHPLARLVQSEILDTLGEEAAARAALAAVPPAVLNTAPADALPVIDPLLGALFAERLLALHRGEPRYFELYQPVAEVDLGHAETFVRELLRGASAAERARRVERWLGRAEAHGELAFLLELERALADLTPATQEQVRERVFLLYRQNKELARRKALVGATLRRALAAGNDYLLYNFAESWVSYVPRERAERRRAERLYKDAVFERAYVEEARADRSNARGHFYGVTLQTESLEAHAGFIEMRLAEGSDPARDYPGSFSPVAAGYARAYLLARRLPDLFGDPAAHQRADAEAIRELTAIARQAPQHAEVHQLWGYVAYQRFLRTGDRLAAVEANAHALIALDLARDTPRARAAVLDLVARVQAAVGNYGLALGWLEARAKLPFASPPQQLSHCLAQARARYHTGDAAGAAEDAERCVAMTANPDGEAARFRPLALDRAGLYHLAAAQPAAAAERYAELWPLVERADGSEWMRVIEKSADPRAAAARAAWARADAERNRLTTRLGQASAALALGPAQASAALGFVAEAERLLALGAPPPRQGPYGRELPLQALSAQSYTLLLLGLRAAAHAAAGDFAAASRAMRSRRDAVAARWKAGGLDEDRYELALCEAQLARFAAGRGERSADAVAEILRHLGAARTHWRAWSASTGTPVEDTGLAILTSFAELHLSRGVPMSQLGFDLEAELAASYTQLSLVRNPAWETLRIRIALYLTTMNLRSPR